MKKYATLTEVREMSYYTEHIEVESSDTPTRWGNNVRKTLCPIIINVDAVISVRENDRLKDDFPTLPEGMDERHSFCRVTLKGGMNNSYVDVVGDLRSVANKIWDVED